MVGGPPPTHPARRRRLHRNSHQWRDVAIAASAAALLSGCASSPYERAEREALAVQRDEARIARDIHAALDEILAAVNEHAANLDGEVYIASWKKHRSRVAVLGTEPMPDPGPILKDWDEEADPPPEDAIRLEWSDDYALAQEQSFRYSDAEIVDVTRTTSIPFYTAEVVVRMAVTRRSARVGEPQPRPELPEGYVDWTPPGRRNLRAGGRGYERPPEHSTGLPLLTTPPGDPVPPSAELEPIEVEALQALRDRPLRESTHDVSLEMAYDPDLGTWVLVSSGGGELPRPEYP